MTKFLSFLFLLIVVYNSNAQTIYTQADVNVCNSKFQLSFEKNLSSLPLNEIIIEIGKSFLGTNYTANTLEKGDIENLVINLTGLDCYTFLESSLVFARCIKKGKTTFEDYQKELTNIRYRDGKLKEYPSRLHYFSDWIYDMDDRDIGKDITKGIGGKRYVKKINFMSTHVDSYKQLKENPKFVKEISNIERQISTRKYFYIPQDGIMKCYDLI